MATINPAAVGIDNRRGSLQPGKDADLVICEMHVDVRRVLARGRVIYEAEEYLGRPKVPTKRSCLT